MRTTTLSTLPDFPPARTGLDSLTDQQRFVVTRISTLNVLLKRRAAIYARQHFDFTLTEWRIVTLLRQKPPISIRELAVEALADAAQISRAAASLAKKGYLLRERGAEDSREILLSLTPRGLKLSKEMCAASLERNDELIAGYSPEKIRSLVHTLDQLIDRAKAMVESDESRAHVL
jgi:DNA-binding MarR family transcriptional regulator